MALQNKKLIYGLLLRASAETLLEVACDPKHLGAEIGFFSVLHTWNQKLGLHPHVHCVIPAGGLSLDHTHWIKSRSRFFLPLKVLSSVFRGKFVAGLKQAFQSGRLSFRGNLAALAQPKTFAAWLRSLFRKDWVVYAKPPFGGPEYVLQYLGRYTHRVAISNHRLVSFTEGKVTFRWRDSAHNNEQKLLTLALDEFLRRFLLHLLPKGFVRIRNFGFLANRRRATAPAALLSLARCGTTTAGQIKTPLPRTISGAVPSVVDRWWSSKGSRLQKSNFVLCHRCSLLPHETRLSKLDSSRASRRAPSLCVLTQNKSPFSNSPRRCLRHTLFPLVRSRRLLPCSTARPPQHSTPLVSSHSISIGPASAATTGGFLLTA